LTTASSGEGDIELSLVEDGTGESVSDSIERFGWRFVDRHAEAEVKGELQSADAEWHGLVRGVAVDSRDEDGLSSSAPSREFKYQHPSEDLPHDQARPVAESVLNIEVPKQHDNAAVHEV
jgi:hypothetical protein